MVTIYRAHGLRVIIFTDDHEPAHVHVFGDGQATGLIWSALTGFQPLLRPKV